MMSLPELVDAPVKSHAGRTRLFTNADEFQAKINAYFNACDDEQRPYTMAGLARALGCSTATLRNYGGGEAGTLTNASFVVDRQFIDAVKEARQRVEQWTEERLYGKGHPAGPIFSLKNNFGWKDTQTVEVNARAVVLGVQLGDEQRRIIAEQLLSAANQALSPAPETLPALSPSSTIAVSDAQLEAKATPIAGVSPVDVA